MACFQHSVLQQLCMTFFSGNGTLYMMCGYALIGLILAVYCNTCCQFLVRIECIFCMQLSMSYQHVHNISTQREWHHKNTLIFLNILCDHNRSFQTVQSLCNRHSSVKLSKLETTRLKSGNFCVTEMDQSEPKLLILLNTQGETHFSFSRTPQIEPTTPTTLTTSFLVLPVTNSVKF